MNKEIFKDIARYSPMRILSVLFSILTFKISTNVLTSYEYGYLALINTTIALISPFISGWIGYVIVRFYSKYRISSELSIFLSSFFTILCLLLIFPFFLFIYWLFQADSINTSLKFIVFASFIASIIVGYLTSLFQIEGLPKQYNVINTISIVGGFLFFTFFIYYLKLGISSVFLSSLLVNVISVLYFLGYRHLFKISIVPINKTFLKEGLAYGLPQVGTAIGVSMLAIIDRFIVEYYLGTSSVGLYSASYRFSEMLILMPTGIIASVFAPIVFKTHEKDGLKGSKIIITEYTIYYTIILGFITAIASVFPHFSKILIGSNFEDSINIIPFVVIGSYFFGISQFCALFIQIVNKPRFIVYSILFATFCNVLFCIVLIPYYKLLGAALATTLSYFIYLIVVSYFSFKFIDWDFPFYRTFKVSGGLLIVYFILLLNEVLFKTSLEFNIVVIVIAMLLLILYLSLIKEPLYRLLYNSFKEIIKR